MPFDLGLVGERPAAAGADAGVVLGLMVVLRRGVSMGVARRGLLEAMVFKL